MIDTSGIDVYGAFTKYVLLSSKPQAKTHNGEFWTACPFCGVGEDRFKVWPYRFDGAPQYWCRICRRFGDIINLVEQLEDISCGEACIRLGINEGDIITASRRSLLYNPNDDVPPSDEWQKKAWAFCLACKDVLWGEQGINALNWLRKRGLTDEMVDRAGLGFNAETYWDEKADWDVTDPDKKKVWIPRGIVIPWLIDRQLWKVNIRRFNVDLEDGRGKYIPIVGGSKGVYGIDRFNPELPSVLLEGEFDKLILSQFEPDAINALATGSTSHAQGERWALTIAQSQMVLVSFDPDAGGQSAARDYWLKSIPHAVLWQPWSHDINDMHLQGIDVHKWLFCGLDMADALLQSSDHHVSDGMSTSASVVPIADLDILLAQRQTSRTLQSVPATLQPAASVVLPDTDPVLAKRIEAFTSRPCSSCGGYGYAFLPDGSLICPCYFAKLEESKKPRPPLFTALQGYQQCTNVRPARRRLRFFHGNPDADKN